MKKYKMGTGKTPSKDRLRDFSAGPRSAEKAARSVSPQKRVNIASPDRPAIMDDADTSMRVGSKEYRELMKDLTAGINEKVGMLKMILMKCGEADSGYKQARRYLAKRDCDNADKVIS